MPPEFEPILGNSPPAGNTGDNGNPADNSDGQGNVNPQGDGDSGHSGRGEFDNRSTDIFADLSDDERKFVQSKGWTTSRDVLNGYRELNKRFSGGLQPDVGENGDLTPEQWDEFGKRVGAPEKAEFYQFQRPEIPENVHYDSELEDVFRDAVHSVRGTKAQANGIYSKVVKHLVNRQLEGAKGISEGIGNAYRELTNEYGGSDSPAFKDAMSQAFRSIKSTPGLVEAYKRAGILVDAGDGKFHAANAAIIRHHANVGSALQTESDGLGDLDGSTSDKNPFVNGQENITAQGRIVKENPQLAARLIRAAGGDPADYGLR